MPINEAYRRQVRLLMRLLPLVAREDCFALKGGTAINLFVRDLPRLSVDIDLMYLPMHARPAALAGIDAAMKRLEAANSEERRIVRHWFKNNGARRGWRAEWRCPVRHWA